LVKSIGSSYTLVKEAILLAGKITANNKEYGIMQEKRSKVNERTIVSEAASHLAEILSRVPFLGDLQREPGDGSDLLFSVLKGKKRSRLVVEVRSRAQMRDARLAVDQLQHFCRQQRDSYPIFCSQYLSPSIRDFCQEASMGYFDFAGNCRLVFDDVFIERATPAARPLEKKRLRSLFAPMAARVLRRLFNEPHRAWKVMALADEADVSPATVSLLKDKLIGEEYAREQGDGFVLHRPSRLLKAWSTQYQYKENERLEYYARESQEDLEKRFADYCEQHDIKYGFTLFSGARLVAPFTRGVTQSHTYVASSGALSKVAEALQMKAVDSGGNFCLLVPNDEDILFGKQEVDGISVVSDMQLYLDLASHPARGEENAEYLLEQRLQPKW